MRRHILLVTEGLVHDHDLKTCELFHSKSQMTMYLKCYNYDYVAVTCSKLQMCRISAEQYLIATC